MSDIDKSVRNAIERVTQQARKLLDEDFSSQLEGTFDVLRSGVIVPDSGAHLSAHQRFQRTKILAAIEHKRHTGMSAVEAVSDYVRDAAFTILNRLVALKILEARELVQECITKGEQSAGYREFCGMAPGIALLSDGSGYRLYLDSLFDEFSTEIKVLFDRRDAASILWPKRQTFDVLLQAFNAPHLAEVWHEDETLGWVYQFFNSGEERKAMREQSPAPRNRRELAARNQFFTPLYVVRFLAENTLGRLWLEMHGDKTRLTELCSYLARPVENDHEQRRARKDPRDLRILDPACGSGHFLLYSFDLLMVIYEEAWAADEPATSETTRRSLREDFSDIAELRRAAPKLIVEHNLYGVDIDRRCAQIAALALWLRAQRAWHHLGIVKSDRPNIHRTHIVSAEPMAGDTALIDEFAARLDPPLLRDLFSKIVHETRRAGELGTLLRVEDGIAAELRRAHEDFVQKRYVSLPGILRGPTENAPDFSGIGDTGFFHEAEARIIDALRAFAETTAGEETLRRRLFAGDAAEGIALIDLLKTRFDVILMNPPFGETSKSTEGLLSSAYPAWNSNLLCAFIARASELLAEHGFIGSVVDRTIANKSTYEPFRCAHLLAQPSLLLAADLGWDVLDANVEVAALVLATEQTSPRQIAFYDVRDGGSDKAAMLASAINSGLPPRAWKHDRTLFSGFPSHALVYDLPDSLLATFSNAPSLADRGLRGYTGHQLQSSRHFFLSWELASGDTTQSLGPDDEFCRLYNGGDFSRFLLPHCEIVRFGFYGTLRPEDVSDYTFVLRNKPVQFSQGVGFGVRGDFLDAHLLPPGFLFTVEGQVIPIEDDSLRYFVLGYLNSTVASRLLNCFCGQHKYSGYINQLPCPEPHSPGAIRISSLAREACQLKEKWFARNEACDWFRESDVLRTTMPSFKDIVTELQDDSTRDSLRLRNIVEEIDSVVLSLFDALDNSAITDIGLYRARVPAESVGAIEGRGPKEFPRRLAKELTSFALGCCFGRWERSLPPSPTGRVEGAESALTTGGAALCCRTSADSTLRGRVLVDDPGASMDVVAALDDVLASLVHESESFTQNIMSALGFANLRDYLRSSRGLFNDHLRQYTDGRRTAPIYWQIGTPSGSYSIWFYAHGINDDTLFRLQNEIVAPKIAYEERQLTRVIEEGGDSPSARQRKAIAEQEAFIEELRVLLADIKRVSALWEPTLDDGLSLTMAPLWRLVAQHKSWQRELRVKWDELAQGKYDWSQIAMRLWPERVIPKCSTDRSLAIAHGIDEMFWVCDDEGRWMERQIPTRSVKDLVRERTSVVVKAALKTFMEAPTANAHSSRRRAERASKDAVSG